LCIFCAKNILKVHQNNIDRYCFGDRMDIRIKLKYKIKMSQQNYYENKIHLFEAEHKILKNKSLLFSWMRLIIFLCFAIPLILFFSIGHNFWLIALSILFLISFVVLVIKQNKLENDIVILLSKIQINKDELLFLDHNFQHHESGSKYEKINPNLSNDFDLFGRGSLFQYLNRCNTNTGKNRMAQKLCNPEKEEDLILKKQAAINELCLNNDYVQKFQSYSRLLSDNRNELSFLLSWITEPYENFKKSRNIAVITGSVNLIWFLLSLFGVLSWSSYTFPIILSLLVLYFHKNKISKHYSRINDSVGVFLKYVKLLKLIEDEPFASEYLRSLHNDLLAKNTKASISLHSLLKILDAFLIRNNALIHSLLNIFFLLDIHICYQLIEWRKKHKDEVEKWFTTIGEVEVLISFASYAFNNIEHVTYPTLSNTVFKIEAQEFGHPLLHSDLRVNNNFSVNGAPSVQIITGANMAGKSTFLRTLAVNLLIAMNGAPVIAKEFSFIPCDILSSIKVQDSISKNESYFYAELLRLKEIIEHVKQNPNTLVILDEILRGTNTKDKHIGSVGILKKLISLNAVVIIATHDLSIAELENLYSGTVMNSCFEVELKEDELFFDYKLKNGISKKLNASFLMTKMEIIDTF
jgi:ABC-type multidrug transport system fused ATPase/permease subunit